ncbi:hypothetical protein ThidrDRAFT_4098 [Thiorhodococcus drewsii AZ1]|uniref:Uncharacterized protein n=1 Tax=Thiorhodococcus drewsii AZ1 TaxID=765913 RepID=G2E735_9GAMM|nr:hypothetical protein [Thiorhodococcus drewsii]EGV28066.1 hypothetical protein ThidrDRAFT_4098 [Thiorhodococcus drewsii AZ1]
MTQRANPRQRLQQVAELVGEQGRADLARWFEAGVQDFLSGRG